ncbi:type II toxin-antitoxin system RelB/DinJ family antitoxin [Bifidobacterium longum subsp. longum]|jgi:DNA-damage-inducible protein J|uniref:type II toxin-antitoxin system RelB/DinJ family antitoxin n=1 Tax=Bifidobacterium longum TaxID=216816 RepID=UPI00189A99B0|nr:type II toxin-antitoxin system RelB/DinJ family antitoxin [Bifidobacterium longum]MDB6724552.1 type II toxin-antitoxin system RelB/DinJ family antitoxin [Bifidobacterium longum]MDB6726665.1 type II toxin-antitoxin system RelB/DinJ family antitoxin [Bifidobacterium longum]MDG5954046.1 type II toxin-antitoxin system RelB/DinJ family antitoxin [Bifidobacterium longum]
MVNIPTTTMRIDPELKEKANEVLDDLGLDMSTAMNMFLKAVVREQGMPLDLHTGNDKNAQGSANVDEPTGNQ